MTITVYSQPGCPQCVATERALTRLNLSFEKVDLTTTPAALEWVKSLGHRQAPVVVAGQSHWSGFRPDRLKALAKGVAAAPVPASAKAA